jgi:uncharacterized protein (DUF58 family)
MNRRGWMLAWFAYLLVFLALIFVRAELVALALPLLVYLAAAIYFAPEKLRLEVERSLNAERLSMGKRPQVKLSLHNQGGILEEVYLEDTLEDCSGDEAHRLVSLPAASSLDWEYVLERGRGEHHFEGLRVIVNDYFDLFTLEDMLPSPARVSIYPQVNRLSRITLRPRQTRGFAGYIPSRQGGSGTDFFGLREYQPGDSPRRINWRISAQQNETLYTNEFEQDRIVDIGLILDARLQGYPPPISSNQPSLFEAAVRAASSLAKSFLDDGNRVSLLIYGDTIERVFPGYGKLQFDRIQRSLARSRTGFNYALENLQHLPTRLFSARSQLVMISPLMADDTIFYKRLLSQGYEVILVSPNPVEEEARGIEADPDLSMAVRLARVERAVLLRAVKKMGARVVDWQIDHPLEQALQHSLRLLPLQRRIYEEAC